VCLPDKVAEENRRNEERYYRQRELELLRRSTQPAGAQPIMPMYQPAMSIAQPAAPIALAPAKKYCPQCGALSTNGAAFCNKCGSEIKGYDPETGVICPKCGQGNNGGSAFCSKCGGALPEFDESSIIACPKCNRQLLPGTKYCIRCGADIEELMKSENARRALQLSAEEILNAASQETGVMWHCIHTDDQKKKILFIAQSSVATMPFAAAGNSWEHSEIRRWLNTDFYNTLPGFLRDKIRETKISSYNVRTHEFDRDTFDRLFLLSKEELDKYLPDEQSRATGSDWWLRTRCMNDSAAVVVNASGAVDSSGRSVNLPVDVRPAFWFDISSTANTASGSAPAAAANTPPAQAAADSAQKKCPKCGAALESADRFCAKCGAEI